MAANLTQARQIIQTLEGSLLVGVSGGGDSVALLRLLLEEGRAPQLAVATFNHNWSTFGPKSVRFVQALCERHGLPFLTATGTGKPATNAEAHARGERHAWLQAEAANLGAILVLAHTQTDVAESFLMRAGKGSGAGGLAALQPASAMNGIAYARPLLETSREDLRSYLQAIGQGWLEDPDNEAGGSQRARIRNLLPQLEAAGITTHGLAASAQALAQADAALDAATQAIPLLSPFPLAVFQVQPTEIGLRLLLRLITSIHPQQGLPVRRSKRQALLKRLQTEPAGAATLAGVKFVWKDRVLKVLKE